MKENAKMPCQFQYEWNNLSWLGRPVCLRSCRCQGRGAARCHRVVQAKPWLRPPAAILECPSSDANAGQEQRCTQNAPKSKAAGGSATKRDQRLITVSPYAASNAGDRT